MLLIGNAHLEIEPAFQGYAHVFYPQGLGLTQPESNHVLCSISSCDVHEPRHVGCCGQAWVTEQRVLSIQCLFFLKHYVGCSKIFIYLAVWGLSCSPEAQLPSVACGILLPWPGIKPVSPELEGRVSTTRSSGKSPILCAYVLITYIL